MDVGNTKLFVKADTAEAEAAMDRLEATLDRILEKQELVAGRTEKRTPGFNISGLAEIIREKDAELLQAYPELHESEKEMSGFGAQLRAAIRSGKHEQPYVDKDGIVRDLAEEPHCRDDCNCHGEAE